jgi:hypothetical protein
MSNSKTFRFIAAVFLIMATAMLSFSDTVRLKDGSRIKGKVVSFGGGTFTVAIGDGSRRRQLTFMASEIESIEFDTPTAESTTNRTASYTEPTPKVVTSTPPPTIIAKGPKPILSQPKPTGGKMTPIEWQVNVLADSTGNGWTNSGWVVKKGQRIRIAGDGTISLGKGKSSPASGVASLDDNMKLLKNVATGALIAVIGDDNNDFIYVGAEREFTASRDGALFLGINEGYLEDNSGSFSVKIEILPGGGN